MGSARRTRWIAGVVGGSSCVLAAAASCSPFSAGTSPPPVEAGDGDAGGGGDGNADAALAFACDGGGGVHVKEAFTSLTTDWKLDSNNHDGTLDVVDTDEIASGLVPPYLRTRSKLSASPKNKTEQAINRTISGRPSLVRIAFSVGLGATDAYAEYGCNVFLRSTTGGADAPYVYFNSGSDNRLMRLAAQLTPSNTPKGVLDLGTIAHGTPAQVVLTVDLSATGSVVATATFDSGAQHTSQRLPAFVAPQPDAIDETFVQCGVGFASVIGPAGTLEVGVDDIDLTVCP
jgi:hypothetical protein